MESDTVSLCSSASSTVAIDNSSAQLLTVHELAPREPAIWSNTECSLSMCTTICNTTQWINPTEHQETSAVEVPQRGPWNYIITTLYPWRWQLITSLFSITCFTCLFYLALKWDGRSLAEWTIEVVSINAMVAVAATALKGSLMVLITSTLSQSRWMHFSNRSVPLRDLEYIDDAARGPWGSLMWLLRLPRTSILITIASSLTLAATAFSFFAQQFVAIELRRVSDPTAAAYFPWVRDASVLDYSSIRAFSDGFLGIEADDGLLQCSTGECTWDSVLSVGVCGTCSNATAQLKKDSCINTKLSQHNTKYETTLCNYTIPSNRGSSHNELVITAPAFNTSLQVPVIEAYQSNGQTPLALVHIFRFGNNTTHPKQTCLTSGLWTGSFGSFEVPLSSYDAPTLRFGSPNLTKCDLYFCLQNYTVTVDNSHKNQTVTNTTDFFCNSEHVPILRHAVDGNQDGQFFSVSAPDAPFGLFFDEFQEQPLILGLENALINAPDADSYFMSAVDRPQGYRNSTPSLKSFLNATEDYVAAWVRTKGNRSLWMNNLAQTINNSIRRENSVPLFRDSYAGKAYSRQAYIRISWSWIAYPASLLSLTLVLFAINLITTHWKGRNVWVAGNLALLLSDVDETIRLRARGAYESHDTLLEAIGREEVCFEENHDGGWVFRTASPA